MVRSGLDIMVPAEDSKAEIVAHRRRVRDRLVGLDYFGARYMSSALGRFSSPDAHAGVPGNPQSWNKYTYTLNNPLKLIDPDGNFPTPAHIQWSTSGLQSLGFGSATAGAFA